MTEMMDKNRTAFVFGASGLVGQEVVRQLLTLPAYQKVVAVTRRPLTGIDTGLSASHFENQMLRDVPVGMNWMNALEALDWRGVTDVYICTGSTIRKAGSREAFRHADVDLPIAIAQTAKTRGTLRCIVISSMGASVRSPFFYLRCKGEMEQGLVILGYPLMHIVRPALLVGHRAEKRTGEQFALWFSSRFAWMFRGPMAKQKPVHAEQVARAMTGLMTEWPMPPKPDGFDPEPGGVFFHESITLHHKP